MGHGRGLAAPFLDGDSHDKAGERVGTPVRVGKENVAQTVVGNFFSRYVTA